MVEEQPKVPLLAAMEVLTGRDYDEMLEEWEAMTPEQRAGADATYCDNNMGYGPEAWEAYCDAKRALGESW